MCGISGFNWGDRELGEKMSSCLAHRGPDASGLFSTGEVTLAHRRLSIIDLSQASNQPMTDDSGKLTIVFNGEIYNFQELREELASEYNFVTAGDTEVILAGYRKWGKDVVQKLNGIFAFAIWDEEKKTLFCARDHMGVKPFFYYWDGDKFIFASEISAILIHDIPRVLDRDSFNRYMRVLYSPEPFTLIKDVYKLSPGSLLTLSGKNLGVERYYSPIESVQKRSYTESLKLVRKTVSEAVERQMISDVPVGIYLSGGIDSSVVLAAASKVKDKIKTFSVGFELEDGEEPEKFNRDSDLARETARYFGTEHRELLISSQDIADNFERVIGMLDEPISNPTAFPMHFLSKFAKREVTVVLSGNGGDELFGGYERYRMSVRADFLSRVPFLKNFLPKRIREAIEMSALDRLVQFEFEKDKRLKRVVSPEFFISVDEVKKFFAKYISGSSKVSALMNADLNSWLPDQSLFLSDKMSMSGSVEERVPLIDREVVDLAGSIPVRYKVDLFSTKKILKEAFKGDLPPYLFKEPKRGWFSPGAKWMRRPEVTQIVKRVLSQEYYPETQSLFNWDEVGEMLERHLDKREYNLTILWAIITFQIWAKSHGIKL